MKKEFTKKELVHNAIYYIRAGIECYIMYKDKNFLNRTLECVLFLNEFGIINDYEYQWLKKIVYKLCEIND